MDAPWKVSDGASIRASSISGNVEIIITIARAANVTANLYQTLQENKTFSLRLSWTRIKILITV